MSETKALSCFNNKFIKEDLPTFGFPINDNLKVGLSIFLGLLLGNNSIILSNNSDIPVPCCDEIVMIFLNPNLSNSCIFSCAILVSILLITNIILLDIFASEFKELLLFLCKSLDICISSNVKPDLPSTINNMVSV